MAVAVAVIRILVARGEGRVCNVLRSLGCFHFRVVLGGVKDDAFGVAGFAGAFGILDSA